MRVGSSLEGLFVACLILAMSGSSSASNEQNLAQPISAATVTKLVSMLDSPLAKERTAATTELFRRGGAVLAEMKQAGAKPMATLNPPRRDVVYSLLKGLEPGSYRTDWFGLHVEGKPAREAIERLGERYGFTLPATEKVQPAAAPTCYVQLKPGKELTAVLREVLSNEPAVLTVNLNYSEK